MASCEPKPCLVLVGGIPGVGKTTFAKSVKKALENCCSSCVLVSYDDIVSVQQQKKLVEEGKELKHLRQKIASFIEAYVTDSELEKRCCDLCCELTFPCGLPKNARYIIVDDNFYYRSMRYEYYQLARKHSLGFCHFFLNCSIELALKQNADRPAGEAVPDSVIIEMASKFEMPEPMKNQWEQFSFVIPVSSYHQEHQLEMVIEMMKVASSFPVLEEDNSEKLAIAENDRKLCSASVVHQSDKALRKIINSKVKERRNQMKIGEEIKGYSSVLNETRLKILEDMKCGVLLIDDALKAKIEERAISATVELEEWLKQVFETEHLQC